ncbi:MAG: hypothetical protein CSA26_07810 [Desulfobacterales bacterium]|nr:MAG: hypothetical protein CSA26_07810 [Desulfobacterales bacterium]
MNRVSLPDSLPVLTVERGDGCSGLFELLEQRLSVAGIRVRNLVDGEAAQIRRKTALLEECACCDLLLIEGAEDRWGRSLFLGASFDCRQLQVDDGFVCRSRNDVDSCFTEIMNWLVACQQKVPVVGCILIGGKSRRMGRPKQLIVDKSRNRTWLEIGVEKLHPWVDHIVLSGKGSVPMALKPLQRLSDLDGMDGPMSGIGAVMQAYPLASILVLASDMPFVETGSIDWLLSQRSPGRSAVVPHNKLTGRSEPLFAWYDFRCRPFFKELAAKRKFRMQYICAFDSVYEPEIPASILGSWRNLNYPEDVSRV